MGADIHAILEVKYKGKWEYSGHFDINRSYSLFTLMANVRSEDHQDMKPISNPRGLPKDSDDRTREDLSDREEGEGYFHSHSYLTSSEIKHMFSVIGSRVSLKLYSEDLLLHDFSMLEDFRIVFAFDS